MAIKFSFLVLGILVIAPTLYAATDVSSEESAEIALTKAEERFKLLVITLEEFGQLFKELSEKGPQVLKNVLKDPKLLEVKTEKMKNYLNELRDYVENTDKVNQDFEKDEAFDMFDEFMNIVKKFDSEKHKDLSPDALLVEKSLKEHGLNEIENVVMEHFKSFLKKFNTEVETYFSSLNDKEKKSEKDFIEWFAKLKAENDTEKQIEMFDKLIDNEDDD